jgi:hypothetical protein
MWLRLTWVTPAALAAALVFSACQDSTEPVALQANVGSGSDTECVGVPADDEFFTVEPTTGTFDNVVVPRGATCFLLGSTVRGNVKALEDSRLFIVESTIGGNVEGDKASAVNVIFSTVRENIHIIEAHDEFFLSAFVLESQVLNGNIIMEKGRPGTGDWNVAFSNVHNGNIQISENGSTFFSELFENTISGDVQVFKNGSVLGNGVIENTIEGNLQCKENEEPFVGQPNVVGGSAEDQCEQPSGGELSALRILRPRPDLKELTLQKRAK